LTQLTGTPLGQKLCHSPRGDTTVAGYSGEIAACVTATIQQKFSFSGLTFAAF